MRKITLTVTLCILAFGLYAQQGAYTPLSFDEALNMTLNDNPQISANKHQLRAAEMERKAAIGLRFPQIGVTGSYVYMSDDIGVGMNHLRNDAKGVYDKVAGSLIGSGLPIPDDIVQLIQGADVLFKKDWGLNIQDRDFAMIAGTVKMPIFMGGKINAANRAARINEKTAKEQDVQSRNSLVSELVERYYGLSLANSVVKVRQQVLNAVQHHLNDAIQLEKNGVIARSERLYMEVKVAEAERELLAANLNAKTILSALKNTVNNQTDFIPISKMFVMKNLQGLEYFQSHAQNNNPQLRQVGLQKDLAQENVVSVRSDFLPQITAMGGYNFYNYQLSKALPKWVVGAGVSFSIFNGLNREFKYSAAKNTVRRVGALENKASNDINILVEKLYTEMRNYADRIPSIDRSLSFADEYLRVKIAGFKGGAATAVDVIDAELNLASTRIEKLQTAYYYDLMLAKLLEAAGMSEEFITYQRSGNAEYVVYEQ